MYRVTLGLEYAWAELSREYDSLIHNLEKNLSDNNCWNGLTFQEG